MTGAGLERLADGWPGRLPGEWSVESLRVSCR
jgi:hypothetical protein